MIKNTTVTFNSIMVRLKPSLSKAHPVKYSFQFHYGSIKTRKWAIQRLQRHSFNSIMVRLKHVLKICIKLTVAFQFHYGSIKTKRARLKKLTTTTFNSIMVRLKQKQQRWFKEQRMLSIPLWFD